MAVPVVMPRQGQSVETCIITQWHKSKGDTVNEGDLLFSYETDKAAFDAEAPAGGILLDIFFEDGEEVPVLVNVAVIGNTGEDYSTLKPGAEVAPPTDEATAAPSTDSEPIPTEITQQQTTAEPTATSKGKIRISPLAKRIAGENSLNIDVISGSGPHGRIIERDVRTAIEQQQKTPAASQPSATTQVKQTEKVSAQAATRQPETFVSTRTYSADEATETKLGNIRKIIASRMISSLQNSAQLTHHISADARKMLAIRKAVKANAGKPGATDITLNDMVCYAVVKALKKHPEANAHFLGESIRIFHKVHLGMAVDTDRGLMVPTLKNADDYNLAGLAGRLKTLALECKQGSIDPELLASDSASFTISNLGAFGIEMFTPVINLPQVGILGVNTISYKPADTGDGTIGFIPTIGLSLTYDHRALDGAPASRFLKEIKEEIEQISL